MPIAITGDMKQAFLQIRIREDDRDVLRFHWIEDENPNKIITLRFTRAIFGLSESPFLLEGTVKEHLKETKKNRPELVEIIEEIGEDLYVDDIIGGGATINEATKLKETSI